ncbi:MAG: hypothetical protein P4L92_05095 [Rudaea sp.]|nr:hypothetical protein [Rudaea sp.]
MHTKNLLDSLCRGLALCTLVYVFQIPSGVSAQTSASTTETLVFVRHGEKPATVDDGQLTCQGFNRSVGLASVLVTKFGMPNYLFAAAPVEDQDDAGNNYYYLRALATIEPTAVIAGQTINLKYGKDDIDDLESELMKSQYATSTVFVAWEHDEMDELVANIVHDNDGDSSVVPAWPDDDYDSIFLVVLERNGGTTSVAFTHDYEGLNNLSSACGSASPHFSRVYGPPPPKRS